MVMIGGKKMKIIKVNDQEEGGKITLNLLKDKMKFGAKTLGLATGSTPLSFYKEMIDSSLDFSDMTSINLDEYVGLPAENEQSYHHFMQEHLFSYKTFKQSFVPNGLAEDLEAEIKRYDEVIATHPIDFQILGIGRNGHIGFNEPGTSFDTKTHLVDLAENTIEANSRFFTSPDQVPTRAISMGIASIMASKAIVLMAYGEQKADAVKQMIEGPVTESLPASILQNHPNVFVVLDHSAASKL